MQKYNHFFFFPGELTCNFLWNGKFIAQVSKIRVQLATCFPLPFRECASVKSFKKVDIFAEITFPDTPFELFEYHTAASSDSDTRYNRQCSKEGRQSKIKFPVIKPLKVFDSVQEPIFGFFVLCCAAG